MYCIYRYEKRKGTALNSKENNRSSDMRDSVDFWKSDIDWNKTDANVYLKKSENLKEDVMREIKALPQYQDKNPRKDAVLFIDHLVTASPEFFKDKQKEEILDYFKKAYKEIEKEWGHTVNAVIHFDETTPHMHVQTIPITKDGRLSAKDMCGNVKAYQDKQDWFHEKVGRGFGLARGVPKQETNRKHLETVKYKVKQDEEKLKLYDDLDASKKASELENKKAFLGRYSYTQEEQDDLVKHVKAADYKRKSAEHEKKKIEAEANRGWDEVKRLRNGKSPLELAQMEVELEDLKKFKKWTDEHTNNIYKAYKRDNERIKHIENEQIK